MGITRFTMIICLVAFSASSAENKSALIGIWLGTIGKYKITACFNEYGSGSYYYQKYLNPIRLAQMDNGYWIEPDSCRWIFDSITGSKTTGKWVNSKNNVTLPIKLYFKGNCDDTENFEGPCGCDLYNNPIEKMPGIRIDTVNEFGHALYRKLYTDNGGISMEWFELCGTSNVEEKINLQLTEEFPKNSTDAKSFWWCRRRQLAAFGDGGADFNQIVKPFLWIDNYLVVYEHLHRFCGDPHYYSSTTYKTFNLSTGEVINLWEWIEENNNDTIEVDAALNNLIASKHPSNEDDPEQVVCGDNSSYLIRLDTLGLVFYTDLGYSNMNCEEEFILTFNELAPILSREGKLFAASMLRRSEARKK